ncbi:MAG TPA: hemerythrin domain-containing protein [Casimicrobiaceae bacterium]|nr:hemerythrin domain-containing protein [Casimicrobiaceae bacterium]
MPHQVSHLLDEEHNGTLELLTSLEAALPRWARAAAGIDEDGIRLVRKLHEHLAHHVPRHFGFEEQELFPRLAEAGEGDLCELLTEEHVAINQVIAELLPLAARVGALDAPSLAALKRGIGELIERLRSHIDKETMALGPACDDYLDDDVDQELAFGYATST